MSEITIYHYPSSGTSRNALALIRNAGIEPRIVHYLLSPPSRDELTALIAAAGVAAQALLREHEALCRTLRLTDSARTTEELIDAMLLHPILINRPIVVTALGTRLCRPAEIVLDILPYPQRAPFAKEGGEVVIDEQLRRVK